MNELKSRISITCVSFTVSLLIICITNQIVVNDPNILESFVSVNDIYQMLILNIVINGLIFITDKCFTIQSDVVYFIIGILQVYFSIIFVGGVLFDLVPLTVSNIFLMAVLSIVIYLVVMGIVMIRNKKDEQIINEKLKRGKR